jgi:hypothetical protein
VMPLAELIDYLAALPTGESATEAQ